MTDRKGTQIERLARIETLIEERVLKDLNSVNDKLASLEKIMHADIDDLARLKDRGTGLILGISLAGTAFGATLVSTWRSVMSWFS